MKNKQMKFKKVLMVMMDHLFMDCKKATYYSTQEIDEVPIPLSKKMKYKTHLKYCKNCNNFYQQTKKINRILKMPPEEMEKITGKKLHLNNKKKENIVIKLKKTKNYNNL